jgi:hypothetical protein
LEGLTQSRRRKTVVVGDDDSRSAFRPPSRHRRSLSQAWCASLLPEGMEVICGSQHLHAAKAATGKVRANQSADQCARWRELPTRHL